MIIDSHAHVSERWYEPVETLLMQMDRHGVDGACLVQLLGHYQNDYLIQCSRRYPGRFSAVVMVDVDSTEALADLQHWADLGARGVRLRPTSRSPGEDPLAIWRKACELGMVVSCVGKASGFLSAEFQSVLEELPGLLVLVEHLGGASTPPLEDELRLRQQVLSLARYPQVYLKVPGLGELTPRSVLDVPGLVISRPPDLLLDAISAFGTRRLMWGSDFPVVSSREGYGQALEWVRDSLRPVLSDAELSELMGNTATKLLYDHA